MEESKYALLHVYLTQNYYSFADLIFLLFFRNLLGLITLLRMALSSRRLCHYVPYKNFSLTSLVQNFASSYCKRVIVISFCMTLANLFKLKIVFDVLFLDY